MSATIASRESPARSTSSAGAPAMPSEVVLTRRSACGSSAGISCHAAGAIRPGANAASSCALPSVRFATTIFSTPRSSSPATTPRAAPPAPSTSATSARHAPSASSRWPRKPVTSVLSPCTRPSSIHSVFTAASRRARSVVWSARRKAASLCGMVTLPPRKPFSAKPRKNASKFCGSTSMPSYEPASPCCSSQWPWISGERECAIGCPATKAFGMLMTSHDQEAERPQGCEQPQERQSEDGRVVALDPLEEVDADALEAIAADASRHVLAGEIEVTADRGIIERPHREPRRIETVPEDRAVLGDGKSAVEMVRAPGETRELPPRGRTVLGLVHDRAVEREHLVGADHDPGRPAAGDRERLLGRKQAGEILWRALDRGLDQALVDARRFDGDRQSGGFEQYPPGRAGRGEKKRLLAEPEGAHQLTIPPRSSRTAEDRAGTHNSGAGPWVPALRCAPAGTTSPRGKAAVKPR